MAPIDPNNPPRYRCVYAFVADEEEDGEVSANVGDMFVLSPGEDGVFNTDDDMNADDGWLFVTNLNTRETGFVPEDYLQKIDDEPQQSSGITNTPPQTTAPVSESKDTSQQPSSEGPPIRRFSDPRLAGHLLKNMDPKAVQGFLFVFDLFYQKLI